MKFKQLLIGERFIFASSINNDTILMKINDENAQFITNDNTLLTNRVICSCYDSSECLVIREDEFLKKVNTLRFKNLKPGDKFKLKFEKNRGTYMKIKDLHLDCKYNAINTKEFYSVRFGERDEVILVKEDNQ